jgi:hypothetical protein
MFLCLNRQERQEHKGKSELSLESENLKSRVPDPNLPTKQLPRLPQLRSWLLVVSLMVPCFGSSWYEVARQSQAGSSFSQYWQASSLARYWLESRER